MAQEIQKAGSQEGAEALAALLSGRRAFVTYVPLRTEAPWESCVSLRPGDTAYGIKPRASLDPSAEAANAMRAAGGAKTAVFIPGRRFDASGTRHGQGGGWYDRFLARVPREWLRVGFCYEKQFSEAPLRREPWDQAMDAVVVLGPGQSVSVYENRGR